VLIKCKNSLNTAQCKSLKAHKIKIGIKIDVNGKILFEGSSILPDGVMQK
jgi:hypothetical protein